MAGIWKSGLKGVAALAAAFAAFAVRGAVEVVESSAEAVFWLGEKEVAVAEAEAVFELGGGEPELTGYAAWVVEKELAGDDAAYDAKPALWGGAWANGLIYTFGEGLTNGSPLLLNISVNANVPLLTTAPVIDGHDDFTVQVIGTDDLRDWSDPVILNRDGNEWTLPLGEEAHFFRVRLSE